ncbi:hypothetical protein F7Q99_34520 [Streptomyces kaniharaensis]|uniref:Uncharacterized protein n=1 Tax=Streptomyces kaniharaensis TaxID=212423 RepID=A0A6N7L5C1_9ACTN|nr:hypothetical protein [Streptomyces kaniharaensis]MQS17163.1 hypothetical protein [Streptomyces kaniharaensis]
MPLPAPRAPRHWLGRSWRSRAWWNTPRLVRTLTGLCVVALVAASSATAAVLGEARDGTDVIGHQAAPQVVRSFPGGEAGDRAAVVHFTCVTRSATGGTGQTWYYAATASVTNARADSGPSGGRGG